MAVVVRRDGDALAQRSFLKISLWRSSRSLLELQPRRRLAAAVWFNDQWVAALRGKTPPERSSRARRRGKKVLPRRGWNSSPSFA